MRHPLRKPRSALRCCGPGIAGPGEFRRVPALRGHHNPPTLPTRSFDIALFYTPTKGYLGYLGHLGYSQCLEKGVPFTNCKLRNQRRLPMVVRVKNESNG
jgi:hypothetical protein